jgi:hypothetical protein
MVWAARAHTLPFMLIPRRLALDLYAPCLRYAKLVASAKTKSIKVGTLGTSLTYHERRIPMLLCRIVFAHTPSGALRQSVWCSLA